MIKYQIVRTCRLLYGYYMVIQNVSFIVIGIVFLKTVNAFK